MWEKKMKRWNAKTSKHPDGTELIIMPGRFEPLQAEDRCTYAGFQLPVAGTSINLERILHFSKQNRLNLVYIVSRLKQGTIFSLGPQTDLQLTV